MALIIFLAIILLIAGPFISIAALNTLFAANIAYTIWTWLAMFWVHLMLSGAYIKNNQ